MKATHALAAGLALAACALPLAGAYPAIRTTMLAQYKLSGAVDANAASQRAGCQYCHVNAGGGAPWNAYGNALRATLNGDAKGNVGDALYLVLKADKDADEDGFSDALEVVAKTLPGNANSKPTQTKAALEAELEKLGGVDHYKPAASQ